MDKKQFKIIIPTLLFIGIISFYLVRYYGYYPKSFNKLLRTDEANITKVFMRNGNDGSYVETTDKEKIEEIINLLNNRNYNKSLNQQSRNGYSYYYDFYSADKKVMRITGDGDTVNVNGTYHDVSKSIDITSLSNWFKSLSDKNELNNIDILEKASKEEIYFQSDSQNLETIAKGVIESYFNEFKKENVSKEVKISEYTIDKISSCEGDINKFSCYVEYSNKPFDMNQYIIAGNGQVKDSWIVKRTYYIEIKKVGDKYILTNIGTGK